MKWISGINFGAKHQKLLSESRQKEKLSIGKNQGHRGHRKVKCEIG